MPKAAREIAQSATSDDEYSASNNSDSEAASAEDEASVKDDSDSATDPSEDELSDEDKSDAETTSLEQQIKREYAISKKRLANKTPGIGNLPEQDYVIIADNERTSNPIMTVYEMVRIIGTRAAQFNLGALPLIKKIPNITTIQLAYLELLAQMTPIIIQRHMPCKKYEHWRVGELQIVQRFDEPFCTPSDIDVDEFIARNKL